MDFFYKLSCHRGLVTNYGGGKVMKERLTKEYTYAIINFKEENIYEK
jgi:hypothetical protein